MKYLIFLLLLISLSFQSKGQGTIIQNPVTHKIECDTINYIATKSDLISAGAGLDSVVRQPGNDTVWNYKLGVKVSFYLDSIGSGGGGVTASQVHDSVKTKLDSSTILFHAAYGLTGGDIITGQNTGVDTSTSSLNPSTQGYVLRHGIDTTSLSNRINSKLNISDTASMLSHYLHSVDTTYIHNSIVLKVNIADTSNMLNPYLRKANQLDTTSLSNRINLKLNISDTTAMLQHYFKTADTANHWLHPSDTIYLHNQISLKLNISDTASMLSHYLKTANQIDTTSLSNRINLKVNVADTSSMLSHYMHYTDTASISNRINAKVFISDTSTMLSPYLRKNDTTSISNRINLKVNIADTASMLGHYMHYYDTLSLSSRINLKVNVSDTAAMLSPYLLQSLAASTYATITSLALKKANNDSTANTGYASLYQNSLKQNQLNGTGFVKISGTTISYDNSTYLTGNQTITLTGPVTGSGATSIATTISAGAVVLTTMVTGILPIANGGTNSSSDSIARLNLGVPTTTDVLRALGANTKTETLGHTPLDITSVGTISSGMFFIVALKPVPSGTILTGASIYIGTALSGTVLSTGNCRLGLFTYSGGTYTAVDSTANDSTLFKGTSGNYTSSNFLTPYTVSGTTTLFLGLIYKTAGTSTTFTLGITPAVTSINALTGLLTNSAKVYGSETAQSFLPSTVAGSALTGQTSLLYAKVY